MVRPRSVLSAVAVALLLVACLADLPAPLACPPADAHEMGNCQQLLDSTTNVGCQASVHACFAPQRACACDATECPTPKEACFPVGECPPKVGGGAKCIRPNVDQIVLAGTSEGCACGCAACAQICDGRGPSIAIKLPQAPPDPIAPFNVLLTDLPSRGSLGLYVRYRGASANLVVVAGNGTSPVTGQPLQIFSTQATFVEKNLDGLATWTDANGAPKLVAFVLQPGATAVEIDCVIPYVTP